MAGLSKREKTLVALASAAAVMALLWIFVASPLLAAREKQEAALGRLSGRAELMKESLEEEKELLERFSTISGAGAESETPEKASRMLLEKSGALAREAGAVVRGLSPLPPQQYDYFNRISVRMELECGLEQLVKLLYEIKAGDGMEVTRMDVAPADRTSGVLRGSLEITSTVLKDAEEEAAVEPEN